MMALLCLLNEEEMFSIMELAKLSGNQFVVHKILPNVRKEFIAKNSTVIEKFNYVLWRKWPRKAK